MKYLIIATALTLGATGAFAHDEVLKNSSEGYQSPLADHGPGSKADQLSPQHGHGDDTVKNFVKHGHDLPIRDDHPHGPATAMHQHGDDVVRDYVEHAH